MSREKSFEQRMIDALEERREAYEAYFALKGTDDVDNQAQNAYTNLIKTLFELNKKSSAPTRSPEEMRRRAEEILESDFGIKRRGE